MSFDDEKSRRSFSLIDTDNSGFGSVVAEAQRIVAEQSEHEKYIQKACETYDRDFFHQFAYTNA